MLAGVAVSQQASEFDSLLASAQQAQARSNFQSAAEFYEKAIHIHPEVAELEANLGLMYFQIGSDQGAIKAFREAIRLKPSLLVPNLFLGLEYLKLKRFSESIPYLKRAASSNPTEIQADVGLGRAYTALGKPRLAVSSYLRAVQVDTQNADVWYHLGIAYLELVESDARILFLQNKESGYVQALAADTFLEQHAFIQAAQAYRKAMGAQVFPPETHTGYGFTLLNQHDVRGAEREFGAEIASNPGSLVAKLGMSRLHIEEGATAHGVRGLEEIWKTDSAFLEANVRQFSAGLSQKRHAELQHLLEDKLMSGDAAAQEILALFRDGTSSKRVSAAPRTSAVVNHNTSTTAATELYASGKYTECSDAFASRLQSLETKHLRLLAFCAYASGSYRNSLDAGTRLVLKAPTEAEGLYWETKSAEKLATEALARASQIDPNSAKMHVLLGDVYSRRMYFPDAEQEYRKALALQPQDVGALFGLSWALLADSKIDDAFGLAQTVWNRNPEDPELNALMGEILCARRDFSAAEPYLKKGLNTKPELVPHVHALLGRVYAATNRTEQGIKEMTLGLSDDKDGRLHYQIARLYLKVGDRGSAKQAFEVSDRLRREGQIRATVALQQSKDDSEPQ